MATAGSTTSTENATLPAYLAPSVEDLLARSNALTTGQPFQQYQGDRVSGINDLQREAIGPAVSGVFSAGYDRQKAGASYTPQNTQFGLAAAAQYMNPYQQGVTDIAKREATRDSQIQDVRNQSMAAQAGAFGGSRQGVIDAENQRNLGTRLNDIQTQGLNNSWGQAQQQFNTDQARSQADRQYGSQAAIKGGGDMVDSAGKAFGMLSTAGLLEQQTEQNYLNTGYQDFLTSQQHPYDQLSFMKNMISGSTPTSTTTTSSTQAPGMSTADKIASGISLFDGVKGWFGFAGGGQVQPASGLKQARIAQVFGSMA